MSELQKQILALPPNEKLQLITFIAEALKEDQLFEKALERREAIRRGEGQVLTLTELRDRLYGE